MVKFQCKFCKGIIESDGMASGEQVHCGHCEEIVLVPIPLTAGTLMDDFIIMESRGQGVFKCQQISLDIPVLLHTIVSDNGHMIQSFVNDARQRAKRKEVHVINKSSDYQNLYYYATMLDEISIKHPASFPA